MEDKDKQPDKDIRTDELPESGVFTRKEHYQHPQAADFGKALDDDDQGDQQPSTDSSKENEKTSKGEGLNEERSQGEAGAFEGFEDQGKP